MTGQPSEPAPDEPKPGGPINQEIQHASLSARVPAAVGRGVFSTGAVVFHGPSEFITDFLVRLGTPHSLVARVVMTPPVFEQFINGLRENLGMFSDRFGAPQKLPAPPPGTPGPSISDLYEELKIPEELYSGVYANAVMIGHTASEFWFDFITNFFPRSSVSCRVYLSAQQVPGLLDTATSSYQMYQRRISGEQPPPPPAP